MLVTAHGKTQDDGIQERRLAQFDAGRAEVGTDVELQRPSSFDTAAATRGRLSFNA
jgi:hypothetical protein